MSYQAHVKPLIGKKKNCTELLNEVIIYLICIHIFFFTEWIDWINDPYFKINTGWSMLALLGLYCVGNIGYFLGVQLYKLFYFLRRIKYRLENSNLFKKRPKSDIQPVKMTQ